MIETIRRAEELDSEIDRPTIIDRFDEVMKSRNKNGQINDAIVRTECDYGWVKDPLDLLLALGSENNIKTESGV